MSIDPSKTSPGLIHLSQTRGMREVIANDAPGSNRIIRGPWRPEESDPDWRYGFPPGSHPQIPDGGAPHGGAGGSSADEFLALARHPSNPLRLPPGLVEMSDKELIPDKDLWDRDTSWLGRAPGPGMAHQYIWDLYRDVFGAMVLILEPGQPAAGSSPFLTIRNAGPDWIPEVRETWRVGENFQGRRYQAPSSRFRIPVPIPDGATQGFISAKPPEGENQRLGGHTGDFDVLPPGRQDDGPGGPPPIDDPEQPAGNDRPGPEERAEELIGTVHYLLRPESDVGQLVRHFLSMLITWKRRSE